MGGRTTCIDSKGEIINYCGIPRNNPKYIKAVLLFNCMDFMNSTAMIRREFMERNHLYYHNGCYGMQDFRFYIESSKVGNISTIQNFLLKHRIHQNSATNQNMNIYKKERAKAYADLQRYSLRMSGFQLSEDDLTFINKVLAEKDGKCDSIDELQRLYDVFSELLRQGKSMNIDYYDEMNHLLRTKIAGQIIKLTDLFENIR